MSAEVPTANADKPPERSRAVQGLRDRTISDYGLDTFKPGHELLCNGIGRRRESLKRHVGHDDYVVIVKIAQSA